METNLQRENLSRSPLMKGRGFLKLLLGNIRFEGLVGSWILKSRVQEKVYVSHVNLKSLIM